MSSVGMEYVNGQHCPLDGSRRVVYMSLEEMLFGPCSYTPEQTRFMEEVVVDRKPLTAPTLLRGES